MALLDTYDLIKHWSALVSNSDYILPDDVSAEDRAKLADVANGLRDQMIGSTKWDHSEVDDLLRRIYLRHQGGARKTRRKSNRRKSNRRK
jgi:hypothetical protein